LKLTKKILIGLIKEVLSEKGDDEEKKSPPTPPAPGGQGGGGDTSQKLKIKIPKDPFEKQPEEMEEGSGDIESKVATIAIEDDDDSDDIQETKLRNIIKKIIRKK
jgi:hypothetical protein